MIGPGLDGAFADEGGEVTIELVAGAIVLIGVGIEDLEAARSADRATRRGHPRLGVFNAHSDAHGLDPGLFFLGVKIDLALFMAYPGRPGLLRATPGAKLV